MSRSARLRREQRRLPDTLKSRNRPPGVTDAMKGVSPTFSGAVAWLRRHRDQLNTTLQLVRMYPNLIKDPCLDGLWDFFQELVRAEREGGEDVSGTKNVFGAGREMEDTEGNFRVFPPTPVENNYNLVPSVYVCSSKLCAGDSLENAKMEMLLKALVPVSFVKLNSHSVTCKEDCEDKFVLSCTLFLFVLNETSLSDKSCIDKLHLAACNEVPILMVRDPGYSLPHNFPECVTSVEPIAQGMLPKGSSLMSIGLPVSRQSMDGWKSQCSFDSDISHQDTYQNQKFTPFSPTPFTAKTTSATFSDIITKCYAKSIVFTTDFKQNSTFNLYSALNEYIEGLSLHLENSNGTFPLSPHVENVSSSNIECEQNIGSRTPHHMENKAMKLVNDTSPPKIRRSKVPNFTKSSSAVTVGVHELVENQSPLQNKPLVTKNSTVHLPPIKGKRIDISPVITQQLHRGAKTSKEPIRRDSNDNISIDSFTSNENYKEPKETIYLLFPKPLSGKRDPEVIHWPPRGEDNVTRNDDILSVTDSSDSQASFEHLEFIPDISLLDSSSPELE